MPQLLHHLVAQPDQKTRSPAIVGWLKNSSIPPIWPRFMSPPKPKLRAESGSGTPDSARFVSPMTVPPLPVKVESGVKHRAPHRQMVLHQRQSLQKLHYPPNQRRKGEQRIGLSRSVHLLRLDQMQSREAHQVKQMVGSV